MCSVGVSFSFKLSTKAHNSATDNSQTLMHLPTPGHIPYRALVPAEYDNLLAAGRIISAEDEGWEITRVIPVAAMTGEAAGVAAALCLKQSCAVNNLDIHLLQDTLKQNGVIFR